MKEHRYALNLILKSEVVKMKIKAIEALQEFQVEELDSLLGSGKGHGVNTISAECRWNSLQVIFTCC